MLRTVWELLLLLRNGWDVDGDRYALKEKITPVRSVSFCYKQLCTGQKSFANIYSIVAHRLQRKRKVLKCYAKDGTVTRSISCVHGENKALKMVHRLKRMLLAWKCNAQKNIIIIIMSP